MSDRHERYFKLLLRCVALVAALAAGAAEAPVASGPATPHARFEPAPTLLVGAPRPAGRVGSLEVSFAAKAPPNTGAVPVTIN